MRVLGFSVAIALLATGVKADNVCGVDLSFDNLPPGVPRSRVETVCEAMTVGPGDYVQDADPVCGADGNRPISLAIQAYATAQFPEAATFAGSLLTDAADNVAKLMAQHIQGSVGELLKGLLDQRANCSPMVLAIPRGATYIGFAVRAREQGGTWTRCGDDSVYDGDCRGIGWARFDSPTLKPGQTGDPGHTDTQNGTAYWLVFKNWSHDRTREAMFAVHYIP